MEYRRMKYRKPHGSDKRYASALDALDDLQNALAERGVDLARWARDLRAERRAAEPQ